MFSHNTFTTYQISVCLSFDFLLHKKVHFIAIFLAATRAVFEPFVCPDTFYVIELVLKAVLTKYHVKAKQYDLF